MKTFNKAQTWSRRVLSLMLFLAVAGIAFPATALAAVYSSGSIDVSNLEEGDVLLPGATVTFPTSGYRYIQVEGRNDEIEVGTSNGEYNKGVVQNNRFRFYRGNNPNTSNATNVAFAENRDCFVYQGVATEERWFIVSYTVYTYSFSQAKGVTLSGFEGYETTKVFDGTADAELKGTVTIDGVIAGENVEPGAVYMAKDKTNTYVADSHVGENKRIAFALVGDDAEHYAVTNMSPAPVDNGVIEPKPVKVMGIIAKDKPYDATNAVKEYDFSNVVVTSPVEGDVVGVKEVVGTFADEKVGDDKDVTFSSITLNSDDYVVDMETSQTTYVASITAADVTVTADDLSKTYGADDPAVLTATVDGVVDDYKLVYTVTRAAGETAGTYTITPAGAEIQGPYKVSYATGTFTIDKAPVTADMFDVTLPEGAVYDGTAKTVTATVKAEYANKGVGTATVTFAEADEAIDAGMYTVQLVVAEGDNYLATENDKPLTADAWTFEIAAKPVTITGVAAEDKYYDGGTDAAIAGTAAIEGLVEADANDVTVDDTAATATFADKNAAEDIAVTFDGFALAGDRAFNYELSAQPAATTATINHTTVYVDGITALNKAYDGSTAATLDFSKATIANLVEGEQLQFDETKTEATFDNANVGTKKTVTFTPAFVEDEVFKNYKLNTLLGQRTTKADIVKVTKLTVTAVDQDVPVGTEVAVSTDKVTLVAVDADGNAVDTSLMSVYSVDYTIKDQDGESDLDLTQPGSGTITPSDIAIRNADGEDVTANYDNIDFVAGTITVKYAPTVTVSPIANYYDGTEKTLVTGQTDHSSIVYSDSQNGTYTAELPKATELGNYDVWYKVVEDDETFATEPAKVVASILNAPTWSGTNRLPVGATAAYQVKNGSIKVVDDAFAEYLSVSGTTIQGKKANLVKLGLYDTNGVLYEQKDVVVYAISGEKSIASAKDGNYVIDVDNGSTKKGANIQIWKNNGTNAQKFTFVRNADNTYTLTNKGSGMVADIADGSMERGANLQQWTKNGTAAQKWRVTVDADGALTLINAKSGLALDIAGGTMANKSNLRQWTPNGSAAQKWVLK